MLCSGLSTVFKQRSERLSGTQASQVVTDLEETPQKTETETFGSISLKYINGCGSIFPHDFYMGQKVTILNSWFFRVATLKFPETN